MYLEKLEIQGFKSFANKNKLEFSGIIENGRRGISAIVGPNGSGKSNIADAVRWALGEQSVKTLRGKKGEDIIFSGSDKKSRLGMAEVSLFLKNNGKEKNNSSNQLSPLDYDQLIITRRLNRNGDSEYLINNNRVRLLEIQMLLAKANIGQKTYSVIGQGIVENFLNTSAAEKKEFFDEATGVKSFQIKRDQALNKLEKSHENLGQVEMLLTEISPRLKTLTRQVEKLKKRDRLEKELWEKQTTYYQQAYQTITKKLTAINTDISSLEKNKQEKEGKLKNILNNNKLLDQTFINPEEENLNEQLVSLQTEKNKLIKQAARLQAEITLNLETKGNFDLAWLNNKRDELQTEKQKIKDQIEQAGSGQWQQTEIELKGAWQKLQNQSSCLEKIKLEEEKNKEVLNDLKQKLIRIQLALTARQDNTNNFNLSEAKNTEKKLKQSLNETIENLNNLETERNQTKIIDLEKKLEELEKQIKNQQKDLKTLNQEIKEKSQQNIGKKTINQEIKLFLGRLEEIEQEKNLNKLKSLIFQARQAFKEKIEKIIGLDEERILEKIKVVQEEIIELAEKRKKLIENLNYLQLESSRQKERKITQTVIKDKLEEEIKNIKEKIKTQTNNLNLEDLKQEEENLKKEIIKKEEEIKISERERLNKNLDKEKEKLLKNLNECRLKISSQEEKIKILKQNYYNLNQEIEEIANKINRQAAPSEKNDIRTDKEKIDKKLSLIETDIEKIKEKLKKIETNKQAEKKQLVIGQNQADNLNQALNQLNKDLHQLQIEVARQETRLEDLEKNIKNENLSLIEIKKPLEIESSQEINYEELFKNINNLKKQLEQIGSLDPETEQEWQTTKKRYDFLNKQTTDLNQAINSLEKIITRLDEQIKSRFEKEFKLIAEKFNKYFNILFDGGQAKIIRITERQAEEEENDQLKNFKNWRKRSALGLSGIDIQAVPPGKKIQSIAMLSGGERAMTAIALICAIINANPSPFVVLDEVDAALDEANSEKLAKILDDLSSQTQFIIITHNRATMRKAEILYGVTMQKDGVSRLLSVKLEEAVNINNKK